VKGIRLARHKITFEDAEDIEAIALAQMGFSNKFIKQSVSLSECQINYRLTKGKKAEGYEKGVGYRSMWRNGTSRLAQDMITTTLPGIRRKVGRDLPKHFVHPTPEVVKKAA
jgi:hypothetical protein